MAAVELAAALLTTELPAAVEEGRVEVPLTDELIIMVVLVPAAALEALAEAEDTTDEAAADEALEAADDAAAPVVEAAADEAAAEAADEAAEEATGTVDPAEVPLMG